MLKKTIALAAGLTLLTGCITAREFGNLSDTLQKGTLLARSLTISDPKDGETKVSNFLGWISMSGTTPTRLTRDQADITPADGLKGSSYTDESGLMAGQTYLYELTFGPDSKATQSARPALLPDTRLIPSQPSLSSAVAPGSTPTLTWTKKGATPKGYLVTVARMPGEEPFAGGSLGSGTPTYVALLDATKHDGQVQYGTPSNMVSITEDQLLNETLGKLDFFKSTSEPLTEGSYAWTVVSIDHDAAKTAFAIDKPDALGIFVVK